MVVYLRVRRVVAVVGEVADVQRRVVSLILGRPTPIHQVEWLENEHHGEVARVSVEHSVGWSDRCGRDGRPRRQLARALTRGETGADGARDGDGHPAALPSEIAREGMLHVARWRVVCANAENISGSRAVGEMGGGAHDRKRKDPAHCAHCEGMVTRPRVCSLFRLHADSKLVRCRWRGRRGLHCMIRRLARVNG